MPKIKTHQATAKRFKQTRTNKIIKRRCGQDHFNSRDRGQVTRSKRRDVAMAGAEIKTIRMLTPYN